MNRLSLSLKILVTPLILMSSSVFALYAQPTLIPLDRIITNVESRLTKNPSDHEAHYILARAHYFALFNGFASAAGYEYSGGITLATARWNSWHHSKQLRDRAVEIVLERRGLQREELISKEDTATFRGQVTEEVQRLYNKKWRPDTLSVKQNLTHAERAIEHFKTAISMTPRSALYHLGLASLYQQYTEYRDSHDFDSEPRSLTGITLSDARRHFLSAYLLSVDDASRMQYTPDLGLGTTINYEAGSAFLNLADSAQNLPDEEHQMVPSIRSALKRQESLPPSRIITPVLFGLSPHATLTDLLAPDTTVLFDLDGDLSQERWPWVKPTTGFLVWDEFDTGHITSGRQLFGSVTWWLFFRNGYEALDALDDNRDGSLTGLELNGIRVWFDRNSNGISDVKEVVSLDSLDITAIRTTVTGEDGGAPMNAKGLVFSDGTSIPTYDWFTSPIDESGTKPDDVL